MLIIRSDQMESLSSVADQHYQRALRQHVRTFAPELTSAAGETNVDRAVELGIRRAAVYGLSEPAAVQFYLELMLTFGSQFDEDALYRWAGHILALADRGDQTSRTARLRHSAELYLDRIHGPENELLIEALVRMRHESLERHLGGSRPLDRVLGGVCAVTYPQKMEFAGSEVISLVAHKARDLATVHEFDDTGALVIGILLFLLGSGVVEDPMYPWIRSTLLEASGQSGSERTAVLVRRARTYLDAAIEALRRDG